MEKNYKTRKTGTLTKVYSRGGSVVYLNGILMSVLIHPNVVKEDKLPIDDFLKMKEGRKSSEETVTIKVIAISRHTGDKFSHTEVSSSEGTSGNKNDGYFVTTSWDRKDIYIPLFSITAVVVAVCEDDYEYTVHTEKREQEYAEITEELLKKTALAALKNASEKYKLLC